MRSQPSVHSSARRAIARRRTRFAVALLLAAAPGALLAQRASQAPPDVRRAAPAAGAPAPDPRLAPESVIAIVLDAFAHVETGAAHAPPTLETAYAFTAPANRAVFGSVERFSDVLTDVAYRPLLGHRRSVRGALTVQGDRATQRVVVTSATGALVVYTFTLTRQGEGEYAGCWMTERVKREPPSTLAAPLLA